MDTAIILAVFFFILYFAPTWEAMRRHKRNTGPIFVLNLLTGWTIMGWFGALLWALTPDDQ